MGIALFVLLLVVPVAELWLIGEVADRLGWLETLALLLLMSVLGAWLLKQQGLKTWRALRATMTRGQVPAGELTDAALILFGGALLLTPGFITDVVGLALLLPPARAAIKGMATRLLGRWARRRFGVEIPRRRRTPEIKVVSSERRERESATSSAPDQLPSPNPRAVSDDSPDRG